LTPERCLFAQQYTAERVSKGRRCKGGKVNGALKKKMEMVIHKKKTINTKRE